MRTGDASATAQGFFFNSALSSGVGRGFRFFFTPERGCVITGDCGSSFEGEVSVVELLAAGGVFGEAWVKCARVPEFVRLRGRGR